MGKSGNTTANSKSIMVYKSVNGLAPEYLCSKFSEHSCASGYSLRDTTGKLAVPFPRTNYLKNSFSYSGAVIWNSLPLELRHQAQRACANGRHVAGQVIAARIIGNCISLECIYC